MGQAFQQAASNVLNTAMTIASQGSPKHSTTTSNGSNANSENVTAKAEEWKAFLRSINDPANPTASELVKLREIANCELARLPACPEIIFSKYMRLMETTLKARDVDYTSGTLRSRAYYARLGRFPQEAICAMAQHFVDTAVFFPAISECREYLERWEHPLLPPRETARSILMRRADAMLADARRDLRAATFTPDRLDQLTERLKRILETEGLLRRDGDIYTIRQRPPQPEEQ